MDGSVLIYAAGNPDAYPLEYYDPQTESYRGVIPRLLEQFSACNPIYEIVYYSPGEKDQRDDLAQHLQVDLVSGYREGEPMPNCRTRITLFATAGESGEQAYLLGLTQAAPDGLGESLQSFFSSLSQETVSGLLLEAAADIPQPASDLSLAAGGLALGAAVLAAALALVIRRDRKRLREMSASRDLDPDTGLGNRSFLLRTYRKTVNDRNRALYHVVCFYVNADCLHGTVNSQELGEVFRYCAQIVREHCSHTDLLARISEHGLALVCAAGQTRRIESWLGAALTEIRSYPANCGKNFPVEAAACIYSLKQSDRELDGILFQAEQEARQALNTREGYLIFSDSVLQRFRLEQKLRDTLGRALADREFQLYIQFYVDAQTHAIVGGEALSRWNHPECGLLMPSVFVPLLEQDGLISKLDYRCLRNACDFLEELDRLGVRNFFLSCNFSRETFSHTDFPKQCEEILASYHFPRELLIFEMTESTAAAHLSHIRKNILALKEFGVRIALDDFGEGFTSFSDLQQYPVDGIKLDKRLIDNVHTKNGGAILRAMVQVGHELGVTILAEGVETPEQAAALREIHCDVIQGFHFYAPLPQGDALAKILPQFKSAQP